MKLTQLDFRDSGYTLTDFFSILDTVLHYKKHFTHLAEAKELPAPVSKFYFPHNQPIFQYLLVKGVFPHPIPVYRVAINRLLQENTPDKFIYIPNYHQGFFRGLEASFIPYVDTLEHRKELILKEINKDISAFPKKLLLKHKDFPSTEGFYSPEEFYEYGVTVGRVYKAWSYLLENPHFYADDLLESDKSTTDTSLIHVYRPSQKKKQLYQVNQFNKLGINENTIKVPNHHYRSETKQQKQKELPSQPQKSTVLIPDQLQEPTPALKLFHVFEDISKYKMVMNLLVEHGYLQPGTYIWKDENKGYKGLLAALLKLLHHQGYYKNNTELTPIQIRAIAKNTFGRAMALITIKKAKPKSPYLTFIPPASTLS